MKTALTAAAATLIAGAALIAGATTAQAATPEGTYNATAPNTTTISAIAGETVTDTGARNQGIVSDTLSATSYGHIFCVRACYSEAFTLTVYSTPRAKALTTLIALDTPAKPRAGTYTAITGYGDAYIGRRIPGTNTTVVLSTPNLADSGLTIAEAIRLVKTFNPNTDR